MTAPSGIPKFLSSSPHNVTSMTVQWGELPCRDRNGEIAGYVVKYIFSSVIPPHFQTITVPASSGRSLIVGGLLPRTSYTFSVRAEGATISKSDTGTTAIPTGIVHACEVFCHSPELIIAILNSCVQSLAFFLMESFSLTTV